jgi:tetrapyrrole methylase family protein/MazG family protein
MSKTSKPLQGTVKLLETVRRLRAEDGCPWDREQTLDSLKQYLIEESYECIDAVDSGSVADHCEELGDVLLQVALHSQIRSEQDEFDFDDVADRLAEKLIRRHPHVFGTGEADTSEQVLKNWEQIKAEERGVDSKKTIFDSVARHLPSLQKAQRIQSRAARVGFDWDDVEQVVAKVDEELAEVKEALKVGRKQEIEEEIGDLIFSVANVCRFVDVVGEEALEKCNQKFIRRFTAMDKSIKAEGKELSACSLEEMERHWVAAKEAERKA